MDKFTGILCILLATLALGYAALLISGKKDLLISLGLKLSNFIKYIRSTYIARFIPEAWAIPIVSIALLYLLPVIIEWVDPTNHVVESEVYQFLPMACGAMIVVNGFAFLGIRINFKQAYKWYEEQFDSADSKWRPYLFILSFLIYTLGPIMILMALL